jgi:selenium-binding protein 1
MIWVFDVASDPAHPKLVKTIDSFVKDSGGVVGTHTFFALPGRMLMTGLSNDKDLGGKTALVEYTNDGAFVRTLWLPDDAPYGYDARVQPRLNRMLTSSFTGKKNYMRDLGDLMGDTEAMKHFGNSVVVWDFHARRSRRSRSPARRSSSAGRCSRGKLRFTITALTSKLWSFEQQPDGRSRRVPSPTSATRRRSRCRSTSASPPTTASSSSTRSTTAPAASTT